MTGSEPGKHLCEHMLHTQALSTTAIAHVWKRTRESNSTGSDMVSHVVPGYTTWPTIIIFRDQSTYSFMYPGFAEVSDLPESLEGNKRLQNE